MNEPVVSIKSSKVAHAKQSSFRPGCSSRARHPEPAGAQAEYHGAGSAATTMMITANKAYNITVLGASTAVCSCVLVSEARGDVDVAGTPRSLTFLVTKCINTFLLFCLRQKATLLLLKVSS